MSKLTGCEKRKRLLEKYGRDHPTLVKHRESSKAYAAKPENRERQLKLQKAWREDPANKARMAEYHRATKEANRTLLNELKSKGCVDCGYKDLRALDFDHLPGHKKLDDMSNLHKLSREKLLAEVAKCEVVCANCHRIRTIERQKAVGFQTPFNAA